MPNGKLVRMLEGERLDTPAYTFLQHAHGSFNDVDSANRYVSDVLRSHPV